MAWHSSSTPVLNMLQRGRRDASVELLDAWRAVSFRCMEKRIRTRPAWCNIPSMPEAPSHRLGGILLMQDAATPDAQLYGQGDGPHAQVVELPWPYSVCLCRIFKQQQQSEQQWR